MDHEKIAFPGGRRQASDMSDQATAERETLEEVGLDLQEEQRKDHILCLGRLDDRIVTNWFSTKVLLVVSSFGRIMEVLSVLTVYPLSLRLTSSLSVYLDVRPEPLELLLDPREVFRAFYVPCTYLISHLSNPSMLLRSPVQLPLLAKSRWSNPILQRLAGDLHFPSVVLYPEQSGAPHWMISAGTAAGSGTGATGSHGKTTTDHWKPEEWKLWGLSLGITSDLLDLCFDGSRKRAWKGRPLRSISSTPVRVDFLDVNWILRRWFSRGNSIGRFVHGRREGDQSRSSSPY